MDLCTSAIVNIIISGLSTLGFIQEGMPTAAALQSGVGLLATVVITSLCDTGQTQTSYMVLLFPILFYMSIQYLKYDLEKQVKMELEEVKLDYKEPQKLQ